MRILSVALVLAAGSVFAWVRVGEVEYLGWKNAVEIDNGDIRVVVVPQIGRIIHYGFVGRKPKVDEDGLFARSNSGGDKGGPE